MASSYEDTVFNFDLDLLLQQTTHQAPKCTDENKIEKEHKAHKAILFLKQNAISNDTLMRQCYQVKDMLHQKEKALFVTKQGYQEACIQYKNALDKCSKLETDAKILQIQNQEIKERFDHLENQNGALQSHIKQLEAYVKEQEAIKEKSKAEKHFDKVNVKSEINESIKKQNKLLIQDLCTLGKILKKEKLKTKYKTLLKKYEKYFKNDNNDDSDEGTGGTDIFEDTLMSSSSIEDISDDKLKSFSVEIPRELVVGLNTTRKGCDAKYSQDDNDRFSDCSNEITSADTGRGSSLAFSDNEKCFHSPEYFPSDNQISSEIRNKTVLSKVDVATNTDKDTERSDVATSPIDFGVHTIPIITIDKAAPLTTDVSTSPINFDENAVSSIILDNNNTNGLITNPVNIAINEQHNTDVVLERHLEKECLQVNSRNNFDDECSRDCEIERILNSMRFNSQLITPIPQTPLESIEPEILRVSISCQTDTQFKCRCESIDVFHKELMNRITNFNQLMPQEEIQVQGSVTSSKPSENIMSHANSSENLPLRTTVTEDLPMFTRVNVESEEIPLNSHENNINEMAMSSDHEMDNELDDDDQTPTSKISTITLEEEETMFLPFNNKESEHNHSVRSRLLFEPSVDKDLDCEDNLNIHSSPESVQDQRDSPSEQLVARKPNRKLTKLDKFRKKMVPKSKIKRVIKLPNKKARTKSNQLLHTKKELIKGDNVPALLSKKTVTANDSSASLNDKTIYDNAVKVMSELNNKATNINSKDELINADGVEKENKCLKRKTRQSVECENLRTQPEVINNLITTRSRSKCAEKTQIADPKLQNQVEATNKEIKCISPLQVKKRLKRAASNEDEVVQCKRILRSSTRLSITENDKICQTSNNQINIESCDNKENGPNKHSLDANNKSKLNCITFNDINLLGGDVSVNGDKEINSIPSETQPVDMENKSEHNNIITYNDMDLFTDNVSVQIQMHTHEKQKRSDQEIHSTVHHKDSILCHMIEKYHYVIKSPKKIPDSVVDTICKTIEDNIKNIIELPPEECKNGMNNLIELIQNWNVNNFLAGLMKYLQDPQRKLELYSKVNSPPAPPMTKAEKILLYVMSHLKQLWSIDIVNYILKHIEHILFKINRTPEFDTIESLAHFYALTCRYFDMRTRLRIFVLNAMYCIQFKAIALIKQTLDVWMHVLPLGHMGIARSPLVLCIVYLLHFYKCEDVYHRVQDIRNMLYHKYSYKMSEWNETRILEMFRNAIKETKAPSKKKVVRLALLVLAKRQGPRWCQKNIVTNMLLPMIEKEDARIKHFCISLLGPLMKPYPVDMKVHCEIVINQLLDMTHQNPSQQMAEAIFTSLMYISKHNQNRVILALLDWHPKKISSEFEKILCDFVREKPAHIWDRVLSKIPLNNNTNNTNTNNII